MYGKCLTFMSGVSSVRMNTFLCSGLSSPRDSVIRPLVSTRNTACSPACCSHPPAVAARDVADMQLVAGFFHGWGTAALLQLGCVAR